MAGRAKVSDLPRYLKGTKQVIGGYWDVVLPADTETIRNGKLFNDGKRYGHSDRFRYELNSKKSKADAQEKAFEYAAKLNQDYDEWLASKAPKIPFHEALEKYLREHVEGFGKDIEHQCAAVTRSSLRALEPFYRDRFLCDAPQVIEQYIKAMQEKGRAASTINNVIKRVKTMLRLAYAEWKYDDGRRYLESPLHHDIKLLEGADNPRNGPEHMMDSAKVAIVRRLLDNGEAKDFFDWSVQTAFRPIESSRILLPPERCKVRYQRGVEVRDEPYSIDWAKPAVYLPDQKSGKKGQYRPFSKSLIATARRLFPLQHSMDWYKDKIKAAFVKAGNPDGYLYMLRKAYGNIQINELNVPHDVVRRSMGHEPGSRELEKTYSHVDSKRIEKSNDAFAELMRERNEAYEESVKFIKSLTET